MHDAFAMRVHKRLGRLDCEPERLFRGQAVLGAHDRAQRFALDVLHRDVHPALLPRRKDLDDAGMVEAPSDDSPSDSSLAMYLPLFFLGGSTLTRPGWLRRRPTSPSR